MDIRNNTIFGWVVTAAGVAVGLSVLANGYFHGTHPERPEKLGYEIAGVEAEDGAADAGPSFNTLLAANDIEAGKAVFKKCAACHTDTQGGANAIGPNLWATVGEAVATGHGGFAFSDALKSKGGKWDFETLDKWLTSPAKFAPGTKMSFAGLSSAKDRAAVVAYLNSLGSNLPLPAADATPEAAGAEAKPADSAAKPADAAAKPADGAAKPAAAAPAATEAAPPAKAEAAK